MKKSEKEQEAHYYTKGRWDNWIQNVKESNFQIDDESESSTAVFVNMMDDVILSCLNVISKRKTKKMSADKFQASARLCSVMFPRLTRMSI